MKEVQRADKEDKCNFASLHNGNIIFLLRKNWMSISTKPKTLLINTEITSIIIIKISTKISIFKMKLLLLIRAFHLDKKESHFFVFTEIK